jgi:hypothetical protein
VSENATVAANWSSYRIANENVHRVSLRQAVGE